MTSIATKVAHVKAAGQTRDHHCHWPGCTRQVPPAMWGCKPHWLKLPEALRARIWNAYEPGQEVDGTPSRKYIDAARAVQAWILANHPPAPASEDLQQPLLPATTPVPTDRYPTVTLLDGRKVSSGSEDWRHECEARMVANLATQAERHAYVASVRERRGGPAAQALEDLAIAIYVTRKNGGFA